MAQGDGGHTIHLFLPQVAPAAYWPFIQRNDLQSFTVSDGKNFMIFELTATDLETLLKGESRVILPRT